ncbi:hypothetical protein PFISCL1PPCAC_20762, partial [Pristionchus fissidentatus]
LLSLVVLSTIGVVSAAPVGFCDGGYRNGQQFTEGSFVKQCSADSLGSWSIDIVGCKTPFGRQISLGRTAEENNFVYSCERTANGATMNTRMTGSMGSGMGSGLGSGMGSGMGATRGCENGRYQRGEEYLSPNRSFVRRCLGDGGFDIVACIGGNGNRLRVGTQLVMNGFEHTCTKHVDGTVNYSMKPIF